MPPYNPLMDRVSRWSAAPLYQSNTGAGAGFTQGDSSMTRQTMLAGFAFFTAALGLPAVQASTPAHQMVSSLPKAQSNVAKHGADHAVRRPMATLARSDRRRADDGANHEVGEHANGHEAGEHANGHEAGEHSGSVAGQGGAGQASGGRGGESHGGGHSGRGGHS
jgi:hypothetical protein